MTGLRTDRRGNTALEFALVFPCFLLFIFGFYAAYTMITAKRAMDFGVEKALRYAVVNSKATVPSIKTVYANAAGSIWTSAGVTTGVTVSYATTNTTNDTITVAVTFAWTPPASLAVPFANSIFTASTLSASGAMLMLN